MTILLPPVNALLDGSLFDVCCQLYMLSHVCPPASYITPPHIVESGLKRLRCQSVSLSFCLSVANIDVQLAFDRGRRCSGLSPQLNLHSARAAFSHE